MRPIDADALKEAFYNRKRTPDDMKYLRVPAELVYQFIENAPTLGYEDGILSVENATRRAIELEDAYNNGWSDGFSDGENERPKGEWIITGEEQGALGITYKIRKCNKCGWEHSLVISDNFCPNCGADMRGAVCLIL